MKNKVKFISVIVILFMLFQVYKFIKIQVTNIDIPKGKIVFSSDIDGDYEIYIMNVNGTNIKQLTRDLVTKTNIASDEEPSFSSDGMKIVFKSSRQKEMDYSIIKNSIGLNVGESFSGGSADIYIMDSDGTNQIPLTYQNISYEPFFSRDGNKIIFKSITPYSVRMININTGESKILNSISSGGEFIFSKDGIKIFDNLGGDIFVTDVTGVNRKRLTNFSDSQEIKNIKQNNGGTAFTPSQSGDKLAIVLSGEIDGQFNRLFKFYTANIDGSDLKEIKTIVTKDSSILSDLKFSPDGDKVIFMFSSGEKAIYSLDLLSGYLIELTENKENWETFPWFSFTFTPDGKRIVFMGDIAPNNYPLKFFLHLFKSFIKGIFLQKSTPHYDNKYLCIMDIDGKNYRRINKLPNGTQLGRDFIHWEK